MCALVFNFERTSLLHVFIMIRDWRSWLRKNCKPSTPKLLQYSVQNSTFFHTIWFHYSRLSASLRIIPMTEIKSHFCVCLLGLSNRQIVYDLSTKINGLVEHFHKLYVHNKIDLNTLYIPSCVHTCSKINT